jgi:futalosine hydrolase
MSPRKNILLVTPTHLELHGMGLSSDHSLHGLEVSVCGFGPVSTAIFLTQALLRRRYHMVVLAGLAGAYEGMGVGVGDVCVAQSEVYADMGRCKGMNVEPIEDANCLRFELFKAWNASLSSCIQEIIAKDEAKLVDMATVCGVSCSMERAKLIAARWRVALENMEGAAAAQVCELYGIPLLEVRAVSNLAGDCDRSNWQIQSSLKVLSAFLMNLSRNWAILHE